MKIVTYNVNGLRQRVSQFGSLPKLLTSLDADIICFQEIKLTRQELTADLAMAEGYESFFSCTRTSGKGRIGYSGVATFCRVKSAFSSKEVTLPVRAEEGFTGLLDSSHGSGSTSGESFADMPYLNEFTREELLTVDNEGRCVITDHGHFVLFNIYGPRADSDDADRIKFKANFYNILQKRWELLQREGRRIFVVGDLNVAPSSIDRCEAGPDFENNEFRKWLRSLLVKNGGTFFDVFRENHPERKDAYTCWPVHTGAEQFNYGSRIDHILACGLCLHEPHDQPGHDLVACHVEECDIMTQFRRWKPGITPSWNGGRVTKLEGSDHAPVFVMLKDIPDVPLHRTPSLSARYMPGIRGLQQTIVSILTKKQTFEETTVSQMASLLAGEDTAELTARERVKRPFHGFCASSINSNEFSSSDNNAGGCDTKSSMGRQNTAAVECSQSRSTPNTEKKKARKCQPSQLSLRSFFQKVPALNIGVGNSVQNDVPRSGDDDAKTNQDLDEGRKHAGVSKLNVYSSAEEQQTSTASLDDEKKGAAVLEWRKIQQRMQESIPLCEGHHEPCVSRVVKKQGPNFGRRFYVCARAEGPSSNPETRQFLSEKSFVSLRCSFLPFARMFGSDSDLAHCIVGKASCNTLVTIVVVFAIITFFLKRCCFPSSDRVTAFEDSNNSEDQSNPHYCTTQRKLPVIIYAPSASFSVSPSEQDECVICLTEFSSGEELRVFPNCKHRFHSGCIDQWLYRSLNCPICRDSVIDVKST